MGKDAKQANTIEKLCDAFVFISRLTDYKRTYDTLERLKQVELNTLDVLKYADVYGAMWTGKELIYIAKMNAEGKLELL